MRTARTAFALILGALAATAAYAEDVRLVLQGYDPVAYFTDGRPVKGDPKYSHVWDDGRYQFASAKHREMFVRDPEKYAPQFGGYCTGSMSRGILNEGDPQAWIVRDGRLYVFGKMKFRKAAETDPDYLPSRLPNARKHWAERKRGS